jgi:hypothetical protein
MTKQAVRKAMDSRLQRYVRLDAILQRIIFMSLEGMITL